MAHQSPLSVEFSRQEYQSGLLCPPPGDLPDPGMGPTSVTSACIGRRVLYCQCPQLVRNKNIYPVQGVLSWPAGRPLCSRGCPWDRRRGRGETDSPRLVDAGALAHAGRSASEPEKQEPAHQSSRPGGPSPAAVCLHCPPAGSSSDFQAPQSKINVR